MSQHGFISRTAAAPPRYPTSTVDEKAHETGGEKKKKKRVVLGHAQMGRFPLSYPFFFRGVSRYVTDSSTVLGLERLTIHSCCHKHRETLALSREKRFLPFNFSFFFLFFFLSLARNELNGVGGCRAYSIPADDSGGMVW